MMEIKVSLRSFDLHLGLRGHQWAQVIQLTFMSRHFNSKHNIKY